MYEGSIAYDAWVTFCDDFSRAYAGCRASLSLREEHGSVVPIADSLFFRGINVDLKNNENAPIISLGNEAGEHMTHVVSDVRVLFYERDAALIPTLLINSAHDGVVFLRIDAA